VKRFFVFEVLLKISIFEAECSYAALNDFVLLFEGVPETYTIHLLYGDDKEIKTQKPMITLTLLVLTAAAVCLYFILAAPLLLLSIIIEKVSLWHKKGGVFAPRSTNMTVNELLMTIFG
jgi:hypothetical protein